MNITCREFEALIDDRLEEALSELQGGEFGRHVKACGVCDHYFNDYVGAIDLAKAALAEDSAAQSVLPEEAVASFLGALRNAKSRSGLA